MVSEARKESMAWMETDYSKHFQWKRKWRLEHLGTLGIMGETAPNRAIPPMGKKCAIITTENSAKQLIFVRYEQYYSPAAAPGYWTMKFFSFCLQNCSSSPVLGLSDTRCGCAASSVSICCKGKTNSDSLLKTSREGGGGGFIAGGRTTLGGGVGVIFNTPHLSRMDIAGVRSCPIDRWRKT